jgi:hypothetical protein
MAGRTWSHDAIGLDLDVHAPTLEPGHALVDYLGGVMDTLDGSHGAHFTYLPIVYNDDCQVCDSASRFNRSQDDWLSCESGSWLTTASSGRRCAPALMPTVAE